MSLLNVPYGPIQILQKTFGWPIVKTRMPSTVGSTSFCPFTYLPLLHFQSHFGANIFGSFAAITRIKTGQNSDYHAKYERRAVLNVRDIFNQVLNITNLNEVTADNKSRQVQTKRKLRQTDRNFELYRDKGREEIVL